ncbi:probable NF-kappa-B essential modulator at N-terminal half [Coccomyxa sp. Obi]|nr:probable NF-kappa-B essential modulator at N-terminal half [Coccomyxa sp. Obi]
MSACALLSQIEKELSTLRAQTVQNLEQKLHEREQQLTTVSSRFLQLQQDFQYNLQLLDGRDAELSQFEAEVEGLQSALEQKGCMVDELQALLTQAQTDLEREQQVLQSASELWQEHHERLLQENGQLRQWAEQETHTKAAEFESRQAALSADLADARSKLEPLTAENARLRSAQEEAAKQLATAQQSAASARQSYTEAAARAEALQRRWEAAEKERQALAGRLDVERTNLTKRIADLEQEREEAEKLHKEAVAQLRAELEAAAASASDMQQKADAATTSASQQQADLKLELADLSSRCAAHAAAEREAEQKLEAALKERQQLEERLKSHHDAETSKLRDEMQHMQRKTDREVQECKEAAEAELKFTRAKLESLQKALKDGGSTTQRLQEAQAALQAKDADLAVLRAELASLKKGTPRADGATGPAAAARPRGASAAAALRYSQMTPGWDAFELDSPKWYMEPLETGADRGPPVEEVSQLHLENSGLQAALARAEEEKGRLCAALDTMRADMEAVLHAAAPALQKSPGVAELERQLADAQRSVERLTQENERLMEISNELRAERHKHERAAAEIGSLPQRGAPVTSMVPLHPPSGRLQSQLNHSALLPGIFGACTPGLPQPYGAAPLQYIIAPQYLSPHAWAPPAAQHDSRLHNAPAAAAGGLAAARKGDGSDGADVDKGHDADVAQRLRRIEALAEEIARAQVSGGQNRQRLANNRSSSITQESSGNQRGDEENNAGIVGVNAAAARVNLPLNTASSRCTPSQRERLRMMQQRAQAPKVPRVRNWNIIDDREAALQQQSR